MTHAAVNVSIAADLCTGAGMPSGSVKFTLTATDIDGAVLLPVPLTVPLDGAGVATTALWPNAAGSQGSQYRVEFYDAGGVRRFKGLATIPLTDCNLHAVLNLVAPPTVDDATAAKLAAQAAQAAAEVAQAAASGSAAAASGSAGAASTSAGAAAGSAIAASTSAGNASASEAGALAIYGDTAAMQAALSQAQTLFNRIYLGGF